jgi:hypothetical protein
VGILQLEGPGGRSRRSGASNSASSRATSRARASPRRVLADPDGGEDWSAARAEIEAKLRRP